MSFARSSFNSQFDERLDFVDLTAQLSRKGTPVRVAESVDHVLESAIRDCKPGDVLVTMSSGSFEGLPQRLLEALG